MPASRSRRGRRGALTRGRVRFLPVHDDRGVWVVAVSILVVGVVMISLAAWIARELPAVRSEEEFKRTEDLLERLKRLQGDLQGIGLGDVVNFQATISSGAPSMYAPKLAGTLSTVDAAESAIRVIANTTRWDFEEGMWRSDNGLSENIYIGNDPNRDDYGYITLDNNWYGNRFITKTTRTIDTPLTAYEYSFSARFVAPGNVTVSSASLFLKNTGNPQYPKYHAHIWIANDDGHGKPDLKGVDPKKMDSARSTPGVVVGNAYDTEVSDNSPLPAGTSGWVTATGLNASLTKGTIYHLVMDVSMPSSTAFGVEPNDWDYLAVAFTEPHNTVWVDNGTGNENRSVVVWTRETIDTNPHWTELYDAEPVFVLNFGGGNYWGNPYHGMFKLYDESIYYPDIGSYGDNNVYNSYSDGENCYSAGVIKSDSLSAPDKIWGENFRISQPTTISAFEVPVDRHGLPTSDLHVYIENSTWSECHKIKSEDIRSGDAPPPTERFKIPIESMGTTGGAPAWYRVTLDQPVTLAADNYWIYLRTKGDTRYDTYDYYRVPLDNASGNLPVNMSWDGANSRAFRAVMSNVSENLSGVRFDNIDNKLFDNVDMPFRLIFENYRSPAMYTSPVLTPDKRVKWLNLTWDNDTPENTQVTVQVRVGDMVHPENPNLPDDSNYPWSEWENVQNGQDLGEVFEVDPFSGVDSRVANALQYRIGLSTDNKQRAPKVWNVQVRYYEGVGTTRSAMLDWVATTDDDFASGSNENTGVFGDGAEGYVGLGGWSVVSHGPFSSLNYGIATVGAGDNIYLINSQSGGGTVFRSYNVTSGTWTSRSSPLTGVKNGTYMTWDNGNCIYCLVGGSGNDYSISKDRYGNLIHSARHHFLRYDIASNSWTQLQGTYNTMSTSEPIGEEGAGDALAWVPGVGDNFIYALTGGHNTAYYPTELSNGHFLRYSIGTNSWTLLDDNYPWKATENAIDNGTDDGASLVWTGGENLYALRGEYMEGAGSYDFARYNIVTGTWNTTIARPSSLWNQGAGGGTGDGAGLVWIGGDNIYAMSGGSCLEDERNLFSVYFISQDNWKQRPELPWGVTDTNGHRLACDNNGRIYAWRGWVYDADIPELACFVPNAFPTSGRYTSAAIDAREGVDWKRVEFDKFEPSGTCSLSLFEVSFSEDGVFDNEPWYPVSSGASLGENNSRYICYRATFTSDNTDTAKLLEVRLYYAHTRVPFNTWTQTDWSGASGLLAWDGLQPTRYYDNENVSSRINIGDLVLVPGSGDNVWGDNFRVEQVLSSDNLNDSAQLLSLRFRARENEDIYGVRLYIQDYHVAQLAVNIYRDNADNTGTPGESLTTENQVPISSTGWLYIGFSPIALLVKDNVYHIVVRMVPMVERVQTDWRGGPTEPTLQVGNWDSTYNNFYDNENVNWSQAGKIQLKQFPGSSSTTLPDVYTTADSYVNSSYPNNNYGGYTSMYVGRYGSAVERAYLKFSLSSIPPNKMVTSATLYVYQWGTGVSANVQVERVDNDNWLEGNGGKNGDPADPGELCWSHQPDRTGLLVDPQLVNSIAWYSWTSLALTSFVEGEYVNDNVVTLALIDPLENVGGTNHSVSFDAKEYTSAKPYLVITYADFVYENGWFESSIYDAGCIADWKSISWSSIEPAGTSIVVKARTSSDNNPYDGGWSDWYQDNNGEENTLMPNNRYFQYRVELSTNDNTKTPELDNIRLCYGLPGGTLLNDWFVSSEPNPLVDGTSRVGVFLDSSTCTSTQSQDGYDNIGERSLGGETVMTETDNEAYTRVENGTEVVGTSTANLDADDNVYYEVDAINSGGIGNYAENDAADTTTGTTFVDRTTLTFTPPAAAYYLISASALVTNSTSATTDVRLLGDDNIYAIENFRPLATTDMYAFGTFKLIYLDVSSHTFKIQYRSQNSSYTAKIENARIMARKVQNVYNAENEATASVTSTETTRVTLTFTPPITENYFVFMTAVYSCSRNDSTYSTYIKGYQGATIIVYASRQATVANDRYTFADMKEVTLTGGTSYNFYLKYRSSGSSATAYIENARIIAVRANDFASSGIQYVEASEEAATSFTSNTYITATQLPQFTPSSQQDYWIIGTILIKSNDTANSVYCRLTIDGTSYSEMIYRGKYAQDYVTFIVSKKVTLTATAHNISFEVKRGGSATMYWKTARLAAIPLPPPNYSLDIRHDSGQVTANQANVDNIYVGLNFKSTASATYYFQIWNWSTSSWLDLNSGTVGTSEVSWENTITTNPTDYISDVSGMENIRVRLYTTNSSSVHRSQEDYLVYRVNSTIPSTDNYRLNWEHRISDVVTGYDNYTLRIYGYRENVDAENVSVYIRNFNTWEFIANLPTAAGWVTEFISGEDIDNYLSGGAISIRYFENMADTTRSKVHIDYVVLEGSEIVLRVTLRVSQPLNENMAYDSCTLDNANVLYSGDNGLSWTKENRQPIYVVDVDTNVSDEIHVPDNHEGNPYDDDAAYSIYGSSRAGVRFTVSGEVSGKSKVTENAGVLVRRIGSQPSGLSYTLYNISEGRVLAQGTVAPQPDTSWSWRYIPIENVLAEGEDYRLYLSTTGGDESNCYQWMSPGTSLNMTLTDSASYDGANTRGESDSGSGWVENLQRDVVFRFVVASSFSSSGELVSSVYDAENIVTWHHVYWSESISPGTSIKVYLRSSENDNNPYDGGSWSDWQEVINYQMLYWENRYIQYRVVENTTDESTTPVLHDITIKYYQPSAVVPPTPPQPDPIVRTLVQTTTADFLAGRAPDAIGENVEVVSPGDVTLMAENYWGNEFAATSSFPMSSRLDSENKLLAVRFVAEADENVENVKFLTLVCCDGTLRMPLDPLGAMANIYWDVLLVRDNNGVPDMSASGILGRGKGAPNKIFPQSPRSIQSGSDINPSMEWYLPYPRLETDNFLVNPSNSSWYPWLTGGQTYYLVVTVNKDNAGVINRDNWIAVVSHKRDNIQLDYWINGDTYNTNRAVLFGENRGGGIYRWENSTTAGSPVEGCDPMYLLCVARGGSTWVNNYEGNPYYKSDEEFYTNNYIGQTVPISSTMKVGAIEFFMKSEGEGIGEAYVGIGQGLAPMTKLTETTYSIPIDYASRYSWARFTLPAPYTLFENETYAIYIGSPSSTEYGYGAICAMKTPWETSTKGPYVDASYGKGISDYIWSYDGSTWNDKDYRDLPFRFVTKYRQSGNFVSDVLDAGQVVDWQYIEWDETRPLGTDIKLYVLAGGERYGPFVNGSSLEGVPDSRYIRYEVEMTTNDPATSPALHEVRIGYRGGFGSVRVELQNQGEGRTLVYEGGAVIVKQNENSTMYSMPDDMIVFTSMLDNRMELDVNYRLLRNTLSVKSTALTAMAGANFYMHEEARVVRENDNMRSVEIDIVSDFAQAWYEYLQSVSDRINRSYTGWSRVERPSEYETKLVINEDEAGLVINENRSIAYRETVREIEVQIL